MIHRADLLAVLQAACLGSKAGRARCESATAMIIVAGLVILMIHLVFTPWPDIFRHVEVAPAHR
jgi:hypothetical protein